MTNAADIEMPGSAILRFAALVRPGGLFRMVGEAQSDPPRRNLALNPKAWLGAAIVELILMLRGDPEEAPIRPLTYGETRELVDRLLPGAGLRRLGAQRYVLTWVAPIHMG